VLAVHDPQHHPAWRRGAADPGIGGERLRPERGSQREKLVPGIWQRLQKREGALIEGSPRCCEALERRLAS
jgi:hypothetical protein